MPASASWRAETDRDSPIACAGTWSGRSGEAMWTWKPARLPVNISKSACIFTCASWTPPSSSRVRDGLFPMAVEGGRIGWFAGSPRHHPARRLSCGAPRAVTSGGRIAIDRGSRRCGRAPLRMTAPGSAGDCGVLRHAAAGLAHSVEAWREGQLVGGLYGVPRRRSLASPCSTAKPARPGRARRSSPPAAPSFSLLDTQWVTPHLERLGVDPAGVLRKLKAAIAKDCDVTFSP